MTDGSLVTADASLKSLVKRNENEKPEEEREIPRHVKRRGFFRESEVFKPQVP
jgi:hypothetical protein